MPRVLIANQPWGLLYDGEFSTPEYAAGTSVTLTTLSGATVTAYTTETGSTPVTLTTNTFGQIPGWVEEGVYNLTVNGVTSRVEARSGAPLGWVNVKAPPFNAKGDGTDDTAAIQAGIDYLATLGGGVLYFPPGDYGIVAGLTHPTNTPIRWRGSGLPMKASNTAGANYGGTRLRRISGTNTVVTVLGTNWGSSRGYVELTDLEISGGTTGGQGLFIQRGNGFHLDRLMLRDCPGGNVIRQGFNASVGTLYVYSCGTSTTSPALLLDQEAEAQGASDLIHFYDVQFLANTGTSLKATGNVTSGPSSNLRFANVTFEESAASAAFPVIDLDYAIGSAWGNVLVSFSGERSVSPIKIGASGPGTTVPHQFMNLQVYNGNASQAIPYVIELANQNLQLANYSYIAGGGGALTNAHILVAASVNAGGIAVSGFNTNGGGKPLLADNRTTPTVASIAALPLVATSDEWIVSGTADITSITALSTWKGRTVKLTFSGSAAGTGVTDGSNLKLAGNFAYTTDDYLELHCFDGTNWVEAHRSVN